MPRTARQPADAPAKRLALWRRGDFTARLAAVRGLGPLELVSSRHAGDGRAVFTFRTANGRIVTERVGLAAADLWLGTPASAPKAPAVADAPAGASAGHRWGVALLRRVAAASPEATLRAFVAAARAQGAVASLCHYQGQPVIVVRGHSGALVRYYPRFLGGRLVLGFETVSGPLEAASPAEAA